MTRTERRFRPLALLALALVGAAVGLATVALPTQAQARDYSVTAVDGDLTVNADGSIDVTETRTFDFSGSFNGVYWDLSTAGPADRSSTAPIQLSVNSVEDLASGGNEFSQTDSEAAGTYQIIPEGSDVQRLKIFSPHEDEEARVRISYTLTNVANAWADTGELYWKVVTEGWDVPSEDVTYRVHLPVPAGQTVSAGDNVRAWGHGPLDASVAFDGNDVVYTIPGVGTDEFAEARITFPVAWLSGVTPSATSRLSSILSEEQAWADDANARREQARVISTSAKVVAGVCAVMLFAVTIGMRRGYKRSHTPHFTDQYFRDVPTGDHPAVLGCLFRRNKVSGELFTATLMRLTDGRVISLDVVRDTRGRERDYAMTRDASQDTDDPIEKAALEVLGFVARESTGDENGQIRFSDIKAMAKKEPEVYAAKLNVWEATVHAGCEARGFFTDEHGHSRGILILLTALLSSFGLAACIELLVTGAVAEGVILIGVCTIGCLFGIFSGVRMTPLSQEAVEVTAQLKALKRWLHDFTLLKEAVPKDVVLWNRLLVLAVVLGEADRVVEQLRMVAPEVLESPDLGYTYYWYHGYGALSTPVDSLGTAYDLAHSVSVEALSGSSNSSGEGFGGGFSSGGGDGGGGGGGGGAF